jgi:uncharacterized protein DUF6531
MVFWTLASATRRRVGFDVVPGRRAGRADGERHALLDVSFGWQARAVADAVEGERPRPGRGPAGRAGPLRIGWHVGAGYYATNQKWIFIAGPKEPSRPCGGGEPWHANLKLSGEVVGSSYYEHVHAGATSWYLVGCIGTGEIAAQHVSKDTPEGSACGLTAATPTLAQWSKQIWLWNTCYEESGIYSNDYASAYNEPFGLGPPAAWAGQHLEGPEAHNLTYLESKDPGLTAVTKATEAALARGEGLGAFVGWVLAGAHGPDPLGTVPGEQLGTGSAAAPEQTRCLQAKPVDCATGNQTEAQSDFTLGGRGPHLRMQRNYNSQLARTQISPGPFGYGWSGSYSAHVEVNEEQGIATVVQDNSSSARFEPSWVPRRPF